MLNNDISNRTAPIIAFNVDNSLFVKEQKRDFIDNMAHKFNTYMKNDRYLYFHREVDSHFKAVVNNVWNSHTVTIVMVTMTPYEDELSELLYEEGVYHTRVASVLDIKMLRDLVKFTFLYYFDTDRECLSVLSASNGLHMSEIGSIMGVRKR